MPYPRIAVIGTAGRDKSKPMSKALWNWMMDHAQRKIIKGSHLVSGGAAWADHIAVELFLMGHADVLTLHLPAPIDGDHFVGPSGSAASAANYYHERFSRIVGFNSIQRIVEASQILSCHGTVQPVSAGYRAMFVRNSEVAKSDGMLAYTFGTGTEPDDGGTKDTWDKCHGEKIHVPLPYLW